MNFEQSIVIDPSLACMDGHFEFQPLVPGAYLLSLVELAIKTHQADKVLRGIPKVKFLQPVLPGDEITIKVQEKNENIVAFSICSEQAEHLKGRASLALR